jgi:hypothetical protein
MQFVREKMDFFNASLWGLKRTLIEQLKFNLISGVLILITIFECLVRVE